MIATTIANSMARKAEAPASSSRMLANRPPTPVTPIAPATIPAEAQTAMSCSTSRRLPCSVAYTARAVSSTAPPSAATGPSPRTPSRCASAVPAMIASVAAMPQAAARNGENPATSIQTSSSSGAAM